MQIAIEIDNVTKKFGDTTVLNGISLSLEKNKIHGLVGRNGSGKTMLLKCVCGFVIPTSGTITVGGEQIGKDTDVPGSVGIIIEAPGFLPNYDGYTNLKFLAAIRNKISKKDIHDVIKKVGLDPNSKKHGVFGLSCGKHNLNKLCFIHLYYYLSSKYCFSLKLSIDNATVYTVFNVIKLRRVVENYEWNYYFPCFELVI